MKKKNSFVFVILLFVTLVLFASLYLIGILNLIKINFIREFEWLNFNSQRISVIYLIFVTIFFVLISAIMGRIILSIKDDKSELTAMNIDDFSIQKDAPVNTPYSLDKIINSLNKNLVAIQKFTDIIDGDMEKIDHAKLEDILKERTDSLYQDFTQMINDIVLSSNVSELLEKILFWGVTFSNSKRGSIMVVDKNNMLSIYKAIGWSNKEKPAEIKIKTGEGIAGKVAAENKRIFVTNIETNSEYDFKFKENYHTKSFISMPVFGIKKVVAVLNLTENKNELYSMNELEMMNIITKLSSKVFELIQYKKKILL
jgi:hypothetical protein